MCLFDDDEELNRVLDGVTDESLETAATNTKSDSTTDSAVKFPTSERQAPMMLAEVTEGECGVLQAGCTGLTPEAITHT